MTTSYDLGEDFSSGPEGPDRSLLAYCLTILDIEQGDVAIEFGVGDGTSLRMIAEILPVIGFDSFAGLPEDWRPDFPKGAFSEHEPPRDVPGATVVVGWFDDTVVDYEWPDQIKLIHFDADLYSSTRTALDSIGQWIEPGCIIVFDEFHGYDDDLSSGELPGEQRAWRQFADMSNICWDVIGHGREQWAIQITEDAL
jgi:hypothetical protein